METCACGVASSTTEIQVQKSVTDKGSTAIGTVHGVMKCTICYEKGAWLRGRGVAELIHDDTAQVHQLKELVCTVHQPFVNKLSGNTNGMISQRPHLSVAKNVG